MVKRKSIGVIGIQGAVTEHVNSLQNTFKKYNFNGKVLVIRDKKQIKDIDALIIPGGESTTISKILYNSNLFESIKKIIENRKIPIMGTCAGCVILAKDMTDNNFDDVKLLSAMNMKVTRNAFGRQKDSFERIIEINGFTKPYNAVFIRAPVINMVWKNCKPLAEIDKKIVMARQDDLLALSYHPELTDDLRIHKYFLDMI
jgi:5'-phosphate synthase pdxT subunit